MEISTSIVILPALCPPMSTSKYTFGLSARLVVLLIELIDTLFEDDCIADGQNTLYEPYPAANTPPRIAKLRPLFAIVPMKNFVHREILLQWSKEIVAMTCEHGVFLQLF